MLWRSAWNSSTTYAIDDVVYYGGGSYICRQAHINQTPGNSSTYWDVLAAQGFTGATGATSPPSGIAAGGLTGTYPNPTVATVPDAALSSNVPLKNAANSFASTQTLPLQDKGGEVFNVKAYGAIGDGSNDDTSAIQTAITAASANGGIVYLPRGTYKITSALLLRNVTGVALCGGGMSNKALTQTCSKLLWAGATDGTGSILDASGSSYCVIEDIGFYANNLALGNTANVTGVTILGNPTYNGSFFNEFHRCYFANFKTGVTLGNGTDQVDTVTFNKCWMVYGTDATGVVIGSTNALSIQFYASTLTAATYSGTGSATGVDLNAGSLKMHGCVTANNKYGIRIPNTGAVTSTSIMATHSENDGYAVYLDSQGNHQKAMPLTIVDSYVYSSQSGSFYLGNANFQYYLASVYCQSNGGVDDITVADGSEEVFLQNVTLAGSVRRVSDGAVVAVNGYYGPQSTTSRPYRLPAHMLGAGNVFSLQDLSNPQELDVYNTTNGGGSWERLEAKWASNVAYLQTNLSGTGVARPLHVGTNGNAHLYLMTNGVDRWIISSAGDIWAATDNANDLGSASNRPRNLYLGGGMTRGVSTKTANYTITANDNTVIVNAASLTITLPSASANPGREYTIINGASGATTTVASAAGTINGTSTDTALTAAYAVGRYVSDGTNWFKR